MFDFHLILNVMNQFNVENRQHNVFDKEKLSQWLKQLLRKKAILCFSISDEMYVIFGMDLKWQKGLSFVFCWCLLFGWLLFLRLFNHWTHNYRISHSNELRNASILWWRLLGRINRFLYDRWFFSSILLVTVILFAKSWLDWLDFRRNQWLIKIRQINQIWFSVSVLWPLHLNFILYFFFFVVTWCLVVLS